MSRPLLWLLAVTLLSAGAAHWWPQAPSVAVVQAIERAGSRRMEVPPGTPARRLPAVLPVVVLPAGDAFDPFVGAPMRPVAPAAPPAPPPAPALMTPPEPPPQVVPPLRWRYLGQMLGPEGKSTTYLVDGPELQQVVAGQRLDSGHIVKAVDDEGVHLYDTALARTVIIPIPAAAKEHQP